MHIINIDTIPYILSCVSINTAAFRLRSGCGPGNNRTPLISIEVFPSLRSGCGAAHIDARSRMRFFRIATCSNSSRTAC